MTAECAATSIGDDRIIRESGIDARVAAIIEPVLRAHRLSPGARAAVGPERPDAADHGRAAGRHDDRRGLRRRSAARFRRCSTSRIRSTGLSSGSLLARHRPAAGAQVGFRDLDRPSGQARDVDPGRRAASASAARSSRPTTTASLIERDQPAYGDEPTVRIPFDGDRRSAADPDRRPDPRCAVEGQQGAQGSRSAAANRERRRRRRRRRAGTESSGRTEKCRPTVRETENGSQCKQA